MPFYYSQSVIKIFSDYEGQLIALRDFVALSDFREKSSEEYQATVLNHLDGHIKTLKTITRKTLNDALHARLSKKSAYQFAQTLYDLYAMKAPPLDHQYLESSKLMFKWQQIKKNLLLQRPNEVLALDQKEIQEQPVTFENLVKEANFLLELKMIGGKSYPEGLPLSSEEEILLNLATQYVQAEIKKNPHSNQKNTFYNFVVRLSEHLAEHDKEKKETIKKMLKELFSYTSLAKYTIGHVEYVPGLTKDNIFHWCNKITHGFNTIEVLPPLHKFNEKGISEDKIAKIIPNDSIYLREEFMSIVAYWKEDYYDRKSKNYVKQLKRQEVSKIDLMDLALPSANEITDNVALIKIIKMRCNIIGDGPYSSLIYNILRYILNDKSYKPKIKALQNHIDYKGLNLESVIIRMSSFNSSINENDIDFISSELEMGSKLLIQLEELLNNPELIQNHTYIIGKLIELGITDPSEQEYYTKNLYYPRENDLEPLDLFSQYKKLVEILKVLILRAEKILKQDASLALSDKKEEAKAPIISVSPKELKDTTPPVLGSILLRTDTNITSSYLKEEKSMRSSQKTDSYNFINGAFGSIVSTASTVGKRVVNAASKAGNNVVSAASQAQSEIWNVGSQVLEGLATLGSHVSWILPTSFEESSPEATKKEQKTSNNPQEQQPQDKNTGQELVKQNALNQFNIGIAQLQQRIADLQTDIGNSEAARQEMANISTILTNEDSKNIRSKNLGELQKIKIDIEHEKTTSARRWGIIAKIENIEKKIREEIKKIQADYKKLIEDTALVSASLVGQSIREIGSSIDRYDQLIENELNAIQAAYDKLKETKPVSDNVIVQSQPGKDHLDHKHGNGHQIKPDQNKKEDAFNQGIKKDSKAVDQLDCKRDVDKQIAPDSNVTELVTTIQSTLDKIRIHYTEVKKIPLQLQQLNTRIDLQIANKEFESAKEKIIQQINIYYDSRSCLNFYGRRRAEELKNDVSNCTTMEMLTNHIIQFIKTGQTASDKNLVSFFRSPTRCSSIDSGSLQGRMIDFFFKEFTHHEHDLRVVKIKDMLKNKENDQIDQRVRSYKY